MLISLTFYLKLNYMQSYDDTSQTSKDIEADKHTDFTFSSQGLNISNLNVKHIVPKIDEIRILMSNENSPHILGLCETFLCTNNPEIQLSICGYNFFRKDRTDTQEKNGGGLLFYFKQSLNVKHRSDIENFEYRNFMDRSFLAKYQATSASSGWIDAFEEELSIAQTIGLEFLLIGDFHINITHSMNNKWMNLIQLFDLTQLVTSHTRVT